MSTRTYYTSALHANANASVHNVSSTVFSLIIIGKHKDHDVKTIKKSYPTVKSELETSLDKIESNIDNLMMRKNEVEKNIRLLNEQNSQSKRQIQQAFEEIRAKLDIQ